MSYCRWSSDDYQCDVYVYACVSGKWTTHVAARRHTFTETLPPPVDDPFSEEGFARHQRVSRMVEHATLVSIGGRHDGESFDDDTPGECADRLEYLRQCGYNVPQYAIDELREEEAEVPDVTA
jgi:hypothetical protein